MIALLTSCLGDFLPPVLCDGGASLITILAAAMAAGSGSANMSYAGKMNKKTIAFQREEAEKNRQFNAAEAEKARQFSQDMYEQYSSPSALVNQYKDAGLNPALLANGMSSTGSVSAPAASSSAMPSAVYNTDALMGGFNNFASFVHAAKEMALLNEEKRQKQAETELALANTAKAQADTIGAEIMNQYLPRMQESQLRNLNVQADAALSTIRLNDSATELNQENRNLVASKVLTEQENQEHIRSLCKTEEVQRSVMAYQKDLLTEQIKSAREGRNLTRAQISEIAHRNNLTDKQAAHCDKLMQQVDKTIESLGVDIKQKELDFSKSSDMFTVDVARAKVELFNAMMFKVAGTNTLTYDSKWIDDVVEDITGKSSSGGAR